MESRLRSPPEIPRIISSAEPTCGAPARAKARAAEGDRIEIAVPEPAPTEIAPEAIPLVIAHEDAPLPYRDGAFEWDELWDRATAHLSGEEDPSPRSTSTTSADSSVMFFWAASMTARRSCN